METMTPEQALENLDKVASEVPLKRADQVIIMQSVAKLKELIEASGGED